MKLEIIIQRIAAALFAMALASTVSFGQQTNVTTTNGGGVNSIPVFTGNANVENSIIQQSAGTVIVNGGLSTAGQIVAAGQILSEGPGAGFRVYSAVGDEVNGAPWYGVGMSNLLLWTDGPQDAVQVAGFFGLDFETGNGTMVIRGDNGNVGIGTTNPGAPLEVSGTGIKLTTGGGGAITFQNGSVQSVAWNGVLNGGDYAESVDVAGSRSRYEPGDVLIIDPQSGSDVAKSAESYSTLVAGIYATKPGALGTRKATDPKTSTTEVPMAMVGIVPTKVSAENGSIKRGDLLVSSSTPGYAMRGTDHNRMLGAVLGKAMGSLSSGMGVIEVLVTLQ